MKYEDVPEEVFKALEAVRTDGSCNMLDYRCVVVQLDNLGYSAPSIYVIKRKAEYGQLVMVHFSAWKAAQSDR